MEIARRLILPFLVVLMQIQKMSQFKIDSSPSTSSSSAGDLVVIVFPKDNPQVMSRIQQQQQISDNLMHSASNEGRRYATQSETTAVLSRNSLVDLSPSVPLMPSDAPAIMLPVHNNHHLQQQPTNDDQFDERHIAPLELVQSNSSPVRFDSYYL
jgi:hypothetical protein